MPNQAIKINLHGVIMKILAWVEKWRGLSSPFQRSGGVFFLRRGGVLDSVFDKKLQTSVCVKPRVLKDDALLPVSFGAWGRRNISYDSLKYFLNAYALLGRGQYHRI